ncbi:MAG: hypothetical protein GIW95_08325 [Candidatus Eremiobacteraeota bacterium]|nr:hypothetical protein [Candidatus Eremiobacteraeota bacterium]
MNALLYLEGRHFRNQFFALVRSPGRLAIWLPYVAMLGLFTFRRATAPAGAGIASSIGSEAAGLFGALYLVMIGLTVATHASGRIAAFRSPAEALVVANSALGSRTVVLWLQLRQMLARTPMWLAQLAFYALVFAPRNVGSGTLGRALFAGFLAVMLVTAAGMPAFLAGRGRFGVPLRILAWTSVALGATYALVTAVVLLGPESVAPLAKVLLRLDFGRFVFAALGGNGAVLFGLVALTVLLLAAGVALGRGALPDLYAASLLISPGGLRNAIAARLPAFVRRQHYDGTRIPAGAWTLLWKDWLVLRRRRAVRGILIGFAFWSLIGGLTTFVAGGENVVAMSIVGMLALMFILFVPAAVANGLIEELGKPLWWLGTDGLRARLFVWTVARSWPGAVALFGLPLWSAFALGVPQLALFGLPAALVLWWALHAFGLVLYALFPSRVDRRGPLASLRLFVTLLYLTPPALLFFVLAFWSRDITLAALGAFVLLALQGAGMLEAATHVISGRGAGLALLERST